MNPLERSEKTNIYSDSGRVKRGKEIRLFFLLLSNSHNDLLQKKAVNVMVCLLLVTCDWLNLFVVHKHVKLFFFFFLQAGC